MRAGSRTPLPSRAGGYGGQDRQPLPLKTVSVRATVDLTVQLEPGADPVALEEAVAAEGRRAARELFREVLELLDRETVEAAGGRRQRHEERWVATLMGPIRLSRYRVMVGERSIHPLDRSFGLMQTSASPALRDLVCAIASVVPYRRASDLVLRMTGVSLSPQTCWRILRAAGFQPVPPRRPATARS
jgi:hypothetical protein